MATGSQRFWIVEGQRLPPCAAHELDEHAERDRFERVGGVRVTTGALGTEIKWSAFSPCFASLYYARAWLETASGPFILRYYLSGWFEDICETPSKAMERIEQVISKSELRITKRAFVQLADARAADLPRMIRRALDHPREVDNISIRCYFDKIANKFKVDHIGAGSTIARFYGMEPVIYPYVNGGSYDEIVCEAYKEVLTTGHLRYDHVLGAFRLPNNAIHWVPYHRVIVPEPTAKRETVTVVTEISPIAFQIV